MTNLTADAVLLMVQLRLLALGDVSAIARGVKSLLRAHAAVLRYFVRPNLNPLFIRETKLLNPECCR